MTELLALYRLPTANVVPAPEDMDDGMDPMFC